MTDEDVASFPLSVDHYLPPGLDLGLDYDCPLRRFHLSLLSPAPLRRKIPNVCQVIQFLLVNFKYLSKNIEFLEYHFPFLLATLRSLSLPPLKTSHQN
jgi:hypothetical protein